MPDYMIAYHGGKKPASPEEGAAHMAKYQAWLGGIGEKLVNPGTPLGSSKIVSKDGVTENDAADKLSGFTVIKAESLEAALEVAQACPFLEMGHLTVGEMMSMGG